MVVYFCVCALVIGLTVVGAILGFIGLKGPVFGWGGRLVEIGTTMTFLAPIVWGIYLATIVIESAMR